MGWLKSIAEIALGDFVASNMIAAMLTGALAVLVVIGIMFRWLRAQGGGRILQPSNLILVGMIGVFVFSGLALGGYVWRQLSQQTADAATGVSLLSAAPREISKHARLLLLMRPSQAPEELSNTNIAWFSVHHLFEKFPDGNVKSHMWLFYLVFDTPQAIAYQRIYVQNRPDLYFAIVNMSNRGAVVSLESDKVIAGNVIDFEFSLSPL